MGGFREIVGKVFGQSRRSRQEGVDEIVIVSDIDLVDRFNLKMPSSRAVYPDFGLISPQIVTFRLASCPFL
jgi:hypothetical protein